jgi:2'-5' RNA ligase
MSDRAVVRRMHKLYDRLWSAGLRRIRAGTVELDRVLQAQTPDQRRGLTLIARPSPAVRKYVAGWLRELQGLEPDQYYYADAEFHVTILSLFTATVDAAPFFAQREGFVAAVDAALMNLRPVRISFEGVTASPGTVMVQGFFKTDSLNELRERLRHQLQVRGLAQGVDERYRLETAHMTVVRFRVPLRQSAKFARALEQARHRWFGVTTVKSLVLVENDWYMSRQCTRTLRRFRHKE